MDPGFGGPSYILGIFFLLKHYENGNKKKYSYMPQGPPNPGFMQE